MSKVPGAKLVGRRIKADTPLGQEIAKLRELYGLAALAKLTPEQENEAHLAAMNASLNVSLKDGIERDSRKRGIRKQLSDAINAIHNETGRWPKTVGVPKAFVEEARAALEGTEYAHIKVVVQR